MKQMTLSVRDRIQILSILPIKSNYTTLLQIEAIENMVGFTDEERKLYNFRAPEDKVEFVREGIKELLGVDDYEVPDQIISYLLKNKVQIAEEGVLEWDDDVEQSKEIAFTDEQFTIIKLALRNISHGGELHKTMRVLYEAFNELTRE